MTRAIIRSLPILAMLAGCAGGNPGTPPNYANIVGMIQTNWPTLVAAANVYAAANPSQAPGIAKIEAGGTTIVNGLSALSPPTSILTALQDASTLLTSTPNGAISAQTKADISLGISLVSIVVSGSSLL